MRAGLPTILSIVVIAGALGVLGLCLAIGDRGAGEKSGETSGLVPAQHEPGTLRVMTSNIRIPDVKDGDNAWPNRRELLVKTFLKYGPDVIGCQEVTPAQGAYLIKELGKWYEHYPRAGVGKPPEGETDLKAAVGQTFAALNTIFYRADRFETVDAEAGLVLPGQLQQQAAENTFFSLVVLKEKSEGRGGATWVVVGTHLRHREAFAEKCAASLRGRLGETLKKYPGAHVVLMGDMNAMQGSKVYQILSGQGQEDGVGVLKDGFDYKRKVKGEAWGTWHAFLGKPQSGWPSDLIFSSSGVVSSEAELVKDKSAAGRYPSDHYPVMVDLRVSR